MKTNTRIALTLVVLIASTLTAHAALIELVPSASTVNLGDPVDLSLRISGLGDGFAPSVGGFDIDVTFDPALLGLTAVVFGDPVLGDQLDLFGFGSVISELPFAGGVNLFELSFDLPNDLDTLQAPAFTLATLTFDTIAPGLGTVVPSFVSLSDGLGDALDTEVRPTTLAIVERQIPEPTTMGLLLLGLAGVGISRSRFTQRHPVPTS